MKLRRVVTGVDESGRSVVFADSDAPNAHVYEHIEGGALTRVWRTEGPLLPLSFDEPTTQTGPLLPAVGGTSFMVLQFGPDSAALAPGFDPAAAGQEFATYLPDLATAQEPDAPGMHRTETIDYVLILDGEVWVELDDGVETRLSTGDVLVQLGARHAWRNKSDRPVTVAVVMTGAQRPGVA